MVVIRLARGGRHKAPFYRVVVADHEMRRDGRFLEVVGTYNTSTTPSALTLKEDRIKHWLGVGAKPSDTVTTLINKTIPGYLEEMERKKRSTIQSRRAKRKARAKATKSAA